MIKLTHALRAIEVVRDKMVWEKTVGVLTAIVLSACATGALAQTYPSKPIRFIVPMAPGGSVDTVSRIVGQQLSTQLGQPVVIENKTGAGGSIAAGFVARSEPDGYTIFVADTGQLAITPSLYKNLPYDGTKPFVTVTEAVTTPLFLAVNAQLPIRSVKDLVTYVKANGAVAYGTGGIGSVQHLGMESLAAQTGMKLTHVPFKGASESVQALATGVVGVAFSSLPSLKPQIDAGRVRVIAVSTASRVALMPEVPTIAESGVPNFDVSVRIGFVLPPGTPHQLALRLHGEINKVLSSPEFQQRISALSMLNIGSTQEQYAEQIRQDSAKYRALIEANQIAVD